MMKHLQPYTLLLLFILCFSCKKQDQKDQPKDDQQQSKSRSLNSIPTITEFDTLINPNAPDRITRKIRKDKEGNLLMASFTDVMLYDGISFSKLPKSEGIESFDAFDALEDSKGNIWIASTHYGVFRYDGKNFLHLTTDDGLAHNRTMDIHEDKAGNIWFGTEGGASRYDGKSFQNFTTKEGLPHNDVSTIIEDKTGKLWFGTRGGVSIYDGENFVNFTNKEGIPLLNGSEQLWRYDSKSFVNVRSIIEDRKGNIWLGGSDGLWKYDGSTFTNFTQQFVGYINEDSKGSIWLSHTINKSNKWGLSRYKEDSLLIDPTANPILISEGMLFGISEDKEGVIWIGTVDGILSYDGKTVNHFRDKEIEE
ncbi:histidine kinase [Marivirga sp. S37H4]|uniref:Histidine kinase n=2 Tax=Marivirga aurantiaca TaxID=2802615 RepID=A0A934X0D3_9BACT|nr:histidine kinase [Marivirga aurantiaca]